MDDEFVCLTALSRPKESEHDFSARLSEFWTSMLRAFPDEFEKVYAETIAFEKEGTLLKRQYLCEESAVELVLTEMRKAGLDHEPVDLDDRWSKYEASPTEWWQIEH